MLVPGGQIGRARANIEAIRIVRELEAEGREATPEEKKKLAQFTGWGSLAQLVFNKSFEDYARYEARGTRLSGWVPREDLEKYEKWKKDFGKALYPGFGGLLGKEEWDAAAKSTLNAHYTDRRVIAAMWEMAKRLGFRGGKVLEPSAGSGLFFGLMPEELSARSKLTGIELDKMTGLILKHLYPDADIQITGFEDAKRVGDNSQDLVISNVPFGDFPVVDRKRPQYSKQSIHNYFFSRAIDSTKPGGLAILISTHHTLDAIGNGKLREDWGKKADLVGAIRLPGTAFEKNAGTSVTTDIVIFRKKSNSRFEGGQAFRNVGEVETPEGAARVNEYFIAKPEMVLGGHSLAGSMYGSKNEYTLKPRPGMDMEESLREAVERLPKDIFGAQETREEAAKEYEAALGLREGSLVETKDGKPGLVQDGLIVPQKWNAKQEKEAKSYLELKTVVKQLMDAMRREEGDERANRLREELNQVYDRHVREFGEINRAKAAFLQDDIEFYTVAAIENVDTRHDIRIAKSGKYKGQQRPVKVLDISKGDIFRKRTIYPFREPESAANISDAAKISRIYRGGIDLPYIGRLLAMSEEEARAALLKTHDVFENPATGLLEPKDEYLSGNVRQKLEQARAAAADNPEYRRNVEELEKVQPPRVPISEVLVKLGSTWLSSDIYSEFIRDGLGGDGVVSTIKEEGAEGTTRFYVQGRVFSQAAIQAYSTPHTSVEQILTACLNMKQISVMLKDEHGNTYEDREETALAREKQRLLQEKFAKWLPESRVRSEAEDLYNEKVNHSVLRKFEVPDIKYYPGASHEIELRPNQKQGVARALQESCLLAHGVGSGKTMLQITLAMEARRIGTARKPLIVVQGSTLSQFAATFKRLYPGANILAPSDNQRNEKNRKRLLAQIATGDWDAVIVPHGFFNMLDMNPGTEARFVEEQIEALEKTIRAQSSDLTRKRLEKQKEKLKARISKLLANRRDDTYWDDLGVDMLIVDEAHAYKRGFFTTKMGNVKGLDTNSSQRSMQLLMKTRLIHEKTGGKNVILATGTPISNTLTEMWTMLRYVRPELLREYNVEQFDDFASMFTTTTMQFELAQSGEYVTVERFNKYINGPELLKLWRLASDVVLTEDLDFIKDMPKLKGGQIRSVITAFTREMENFIKAAQNLRKAWDKSGQEKMKRMSLPLEIETMLRKGLVDLRLLDPRSLRELGLEQFRDDPESKLNTAVRNIYEIYRRDQDIFGTQLVFADVFQNKSTGFNVFEEMRDKLVALGVPGDEIAIIHEHDSDSKRETLFEKLNSGEVRVLFGTTEKLGVGVNVQERMSALHHLDAPPRPMDFEQRNGRIRRPGNINKEIEILAYGVEKTPDAAAYQRLVAKQKFINQILRGELTGRSFENPFDENQGMFEQLEEAASGDPRIREKNALASQIINLEMLKRGYEQEMSQKRADLRGRRNALEKSEQQLDDAIAATKFYKQHFPEGKPGGLEKISRETLAWLKQSESEMLAELSRDYREVGLWNGSNAGKYTHKRELDLGHGVKAIIRLKPTTQFNKEANRYEWDIESNYTLSGPYDLDVTDTFKGSGLFTRIANVLADKAEAEKRARQAIKGHKEAIAALEDAVREPFGRAVELDAAQKRIREIENELKRETSRDKDSLASIRPGEFLAARNESAKGLAVGKLKEIVDRLNRLAQNAGEVEAVQSFWDLPGRLQQRFASHVSGLEGVYDPATGKVWLVADNLESARRATEVWCHEQIVHNGLRGLFGEAERKRVLNQIWLALGGMGNRTVRQVAEAYGLDPRSSMEARLQVMEETLASMAERNQAGLLNRQEENLWQKIVRIVASAINKIIEKLTGTKSRMGMEEVDRLLSALGQYVMGGREQGRQTGEGEAAASLGAKGEVNSYGVPMERVTEIEGNITSEELNAALQELAGQDLENVLEGLTAQVNGNQRRKLESKKARQQSVDNGFSNAEHRVAVSKIANIWKWAAEAKGIGGRKEDNPDTTIRRFVSALNVNGKDSFAWLTIKDTQTGLRIYSAELLTKKELQEKFDGVVADKALTGAASRSFKETLARLAGPVKSESGSPLASLKLSDLLSLSGKKTAELANAPEIAGNFNKDDLKWYQHFFALPHWISKTYKNFAKIYDRQNQRRDERNAKVMQSLQEIPSLFVDGKKIDAKDMESLNSLVWEIEGKPLPFEKEGKVEKYLPDGQFENGRTRIRPNPAFYREYEKAIQDMKATPAAKKAMLGIRRSLDLDLANAYNRLAEMSEVSDDAITKLRNNIGNVHNYFPHHRYGQYYVQAIDSEGNVVYREHFDALTKSEAARKAREIGARERAKYPDAKWKQGINSKLPDEVLGAPIDPEAMEQIIKAAASKIPDKEQARQIEAMLCAATADVLKTRGWAEHAIGRKGVPGHETHDLVRVLYDYKNGLYGWLTKMDAARDFSRALGEIDARKQPKLWGYASRYIRDMLRNYDSIDRMTGNIKAAAFAWYLGMNIKAAAVNATQNLIVGVPRLQMDVQGGGRIWLKAAMDAIVNRVTGNTGKNLTAEEARLVKELYEEGVISDAFMSEVRGHLQGVSFASGWNKFTRILGIPMSEVERFNRASLALAAFRAALAGKLKKSAMAKYGINGKANYEQAKAFATEVVNDAHFVYGKSNLSEMLRGNATGRGLGSLYTFRTFSHSMVNMWLWALFHRGREGAMFTAKSLGATIALGGLTAFPFYETLAALCQMASGDDEDWTEKIRKYMPENNVMRDVVCYGVLALGGISLGGSLQMETPFTRGMQKAEDADDFVSMLGEGILGIPYDLFKKGTKALEAYGEGEYFRALKEAMPTFVRNGMDGWQLYFEGQHNRRGKPITRPGETEPVKLTGYEAIMKGVLGFQPVSSTKRYAAYAAGQRAQKLRSDAIERVVRKFLEARKTGDAKFAAEGRAEMQRWNEEKKAEGKEYLMFRMKDVMSRVNRRKATKPNARNRKEGERQMELWGV